MSNISNIRRAQLIAPFGPGSLVVLRNGLSVIVAGLDHWFATNENSQAVDVDRQEFKFREWRLEKELGVDFFCLPPDYRRPSRGGSKIKNALLTIPSLRFPTWHVCRFCNRMERKPLTHDGHVFCPRCQSQKGKNIRMSQVRFVALCEDGHLQDFPWVEWVHRQAEPRCTGPLELESKGGGALSSIYVHCITCSKNRSLANITQDSETSSFLSDNLARDEGGGARYLCRGVRPWLGEEQGCGCTRPLVGGLRSATNVHFGDVQSAIYLPHKLLAAPGSTIAVIVEILRGPDLSHIFSVIKGIGSVVPAQIIPLLRSRPELAQYSDADLSVALATVLGTQPPGSAIPTDVASQTRVATDDRWTAFRRVEFNVLSQTQDDKDLRIKPADLSNLSDPALKRLIAGINLVEKLRETRVFTGFSRLIAGGGLDEEMKKENLRLTEVPEGERWLPAYKVFGEGIFIRLNETELAMWEQREDVRQRIAILKDNEAKAAATRHRSSEDVTPRLVLIHTIAHLLINRLTFECGYSSASLRERLFVSANKDHPMAGILIYTASGDSEGSMGGLVRMGKPQNLERILRKAFEDAKWCSNDPVCMESAEYGQGPESLNLAACHSCALLPETACERFNHLLDRGLVIGSFNNPLIGLFSDLAVARGT